MSKTVKKSWRCFHCDEVFRDRACAQAHFGPSLHSQVSCSVDASRLRELEKQLADYRNEDTSLHRQIERLETDYQLKVRRANEKGYADGLRDGRKIKKEAFPE